MDIRPFPSGPLHLLPWNVDLLYVSELPKRQSVFGVADIGPGQFDRYGAVLNVTEYRYHPVAFPDGWEGIGGPTITIHDGIYADDSPALFHYFFPGEESWLQEIIREIPKRLIKS